MSPMATIAVISFVLRPDRSVPLHLDCRLSFRFLRPSKLHLSYSRPSHPISLQAARQNTLQVRLLWPSASFPAKAPASKSKIITSINALTRIRRLCCFLFFLLLVFLLFPESLPLLPLYSATAKHHLSSRACRLQK